MNPHPPKPKCCCVSCEHLKISNTNRRLWTEHVLWTRFFIISTAFCLPDLPFVTQRLLQNPKDFEEELCHFYGKEKAECFEKLLTEHLLIAAKLVNAIKDCKLYEVEKLKKKWYENAAEIAKFLACINPCWEECVWKELLFEHLRMTEDEAVQILTGKYEKSIEEYDDIQAEALKMADVMTCGIVKQFCIC